MIFKLLFLISCLYQVLAFFLFARFLRESEDYEPAENPPGITQIKPIHKLSAESPSHLRSFVQQRYRGPHELIFSTHAGDPAGQVVKDWGGTTRLAEAGLELPGSNRKVVSMMAGYGLSRHDLLIFSDADMRVSPDYLERVASVFEDPSVGGATCLYCVRRYQNRPQAFEGLCIADFLTSVLVARRTEGISFALGATMAFRRQALDRIEGLESVVDYLADDFQLGHRVARSGYQMALAPAIVEAVTPPTRWRGALLHQLRWMVTSRVSRPGGHFAFIVTQGLAWALLLGPSALGFWIGLRVALGHFTQHLLESDLKNHAWLYPLKDVLFLGLWLASFLTRKVYWAGTWFEVASDGSMRPAS